MHTTIHLLQKVVLKRSGTLFKVVFIDHYYSHTKLHLTFRGGGSNSNAICW